MHHSISLTTNFVKNFFPGNGLTSQQQTSSHDAQTASSVPEQIAHVPLEEQQQQQNISNSSVMNHQQQKAIDVEPSSSSNTLESNNNASERVPTAETTQVSSPANSRSVEQTPEVVENVKPISAEEFRLVKFKYDQLKVSLFVKERC